MCDVNEIDVRDGEIKTRANVRFIINLIITNNNYICYCGGLRLSKSRSKYIISFKKMQIGTIVEYLTAYLLLYLLDIRSQVYYENAVSTCTRIIFIIIIHYIYMHYL